MDLTTSLKIENLLVKLVPLYNGMRDIIENKPYETIMEVLQFRLPKEAEAFSYNHKDMGVRSLSQLQIDGYDIKALIDDLELVINKGDRL